jgi:hypothetical protein
MMPYHLNEISRKPRIPPYPDGFVVDGALHTSAHDQMLSGKVTSEIDAWAQTCVSEPTSTPTSNHLLCHFDTTRALLTEPPSQTGVPFKLCI